MIDMQWFVSAVPSVLDAERVLVVHGERNNPTRQDMLLSWVLDLPCANLTPEAHVKPGDHLQRCEIICLSCISIPECSESDHRMQRQSIAQWRFPCVPEDSSADDVSYAVEGTSR